MFHDLECPGLVKGLSEWQMGYEQDEEVDQRRRRLQDLDLQM
jgi:hypothetical protein